METKNSKNKKELELNAFNDFAKDLNLNLRVEVNKSPFNDNKNLMLMSGKNEIKRLNVKEVVLLVDILIGVKNVK